MAEITKHVLVRIPMTGEPLNNIVEKHNTIASIKGTVWFGSRGQAPAESRLLSLAQQVEHSTPTFLYLVQRNSQSIQVFQSRIYGFAHSIPPEDLPLIPPYYESFGYGFKPAVWIRVGELKESRDTALKLLQVERTGSPVIFVLEKSMASILIVAEATIEPKAPVKRSPWSTHQRSV